MLLLRTLYSLSLQLLFLFFFFLYHTLALASSATSFQKDPPSITYSFSLHIDTQYSHLGYWCLTLLTSSTPGLVHFTNVYLRTFSTLSNIYRPSACGIEQVVDMAWPISSVLSARLPARPTMRCCREKVAQSLDLLRSGCDSKRKIFYNRHKVYIPRLYAPSTSC